MFICTIFVYEIRHKFSIEYESEILRYILLISGNRRNYSINVVKIKWNIKYSRKCFHFD